MKVKQATADNFEELQKELQAMLEQEMPNCGEQAERVSQEAEQAVEVTRKRVELINAKKKEEEDKLKGVEQKKKEIKEKAEQLVAELGGMVDFAEKGLGQLKKQIETFGAEKEILPDLVEIRWRKIQESGEEVEALAQKCSDFFRENHQAMKPPVQTKRPPTPAEKAAMAAQAKAKAENAALAIEDTTKSDDPALAKAEEEEKNKPDLKEVLAGLIQRISVCKKQVEVESNQAVEVKASVEHRAKAFGKHEKVRNTFRRYDKAKNGLLFKRNVMAYAAGEFNFEIPLDVFEGFWPLHSEYSAKHGEKGVTWDQFQDLKVSIGIAREIKRDAKRKADREAEGESDEKQAKTE